MEMGRWTMTSHSVLTLEPKLRPQLAADIQVPRTALLDRLQASSRTPVAAILAPPGYGKTTLLAQWAERDPRAFGWLTINRGDNDPGVLLRDLAAALDRVEPAGPGMVKAPEVPRAAVDEQSGRARRGRAADDRNRTAAAGGASA